jgi:hypothetical protein
MATRADAHTSPQVAEPHREPPDGFHIRAAAFQPVRAAYARHVLLEGPSLDPRGRRALVVGCAGEPYENEFCQFLAFRWGRVERDYVLENIQRFERACRALTARGVEEASAPPLRDAGGAAAAGAA